MTLTQRIERARAEKALQQAKERLAKVGTEEAVALIRCEMKEQARA